MQDVSEIDLMLMRGDYKSVIDTCRQILSFDSLNADIHYKMGLAYQNVLEEDLSLACFSRAASLEPGNETYNFILARAYYNKGKNKLAEPVLFSLYSADTMNWIYAHYLTGIYVQDSRYNEAINIYKRFLAKDSANYVYLDKIGFASLKNGEYKYATELYEKSLAINPKDISAIKNLAYLYTVDRRPDTAIQILTEAIKTDPADMDLYARRAQINYSRNYTKRALDDYLVILASGDSSQIYLKRAGIGYCNNLQPGIALKFLLKAYKKDSSDYETCSYLAQSYYKLRDMEKSVTFYNRVIKILMPIHKQLGVTYLLNAESQKSNGMFKEAIAAYLKADAINSNPNLYMIVANLYDEKLKNSERAIYYYQLFLDNFKHIQKKFTPEYIGSIEKRLEFLKKSMPPSDPH
jgi:tetratricopeptide (TPR) repeat protein